MGSQFTSPPTIPSVPKPPHVTSAITQGSLNDLDFFFALTEKGRKLSEHDIDAGLVKDFLRDIGSNIRDQDLENPRQLYENMRLVRTMPAIERKMAKR